MPKKSIIFFDIDSTLLNDDKELPTSAKKAIGELQEAGHIVAIATGRAPFMFTDLLDELNINTYVSYNGQYVVLNGEVIYTNPLNPVSLEELTETALQNEHPVVFMDQKDMKANVPEHSYITESITTLKVGLPTHDPYYYKNNELYQSLLFCTEGEEKQYEEKFPDFDFIRWHPFSVDILPSGGSKAKGIKIITDKLNIPEDQHYAFGDGLNDVEMLKSIKNSVAMGNAKDEAKKAAKHVTKSVDDDGIHHGLQMVGLL